MELDPSRMIMTGFFQVPPGLCHYILSRSTSDYFINIDPTLLNQCCWSIGSNSAIGEGGAPHQVCQVASPKE
jgi:hypothetical protein